MSKKAKYVISNFLTPFILFACLIGVFLALGNRLTIVTGYSMEPNLRNGQVCLSTTLKVNAIARYDVVVINPAEYGEAIIKRVIGLPNEQVVCTDGKIYVDGLKINDEYGSGYTSDFNVTLGENEYFCLGDNREHSTDSRVLGAFSKDEIITVLVK